MTENTHRHAHMPMLMVLGNIAGQRCSTPDRQIDLFPRQREAARRDPQLADIHKHTIRRRNTSFAFITSKTFHLKSPSRNIYRCPLAF